MSLALNTLQGLVIVDAGSGMPPALISKFLGENGATVIRAVPADGDPFASEYRAYEAWRSGQQLSNAPLEQLLARADVCLLGGEDFPGLQRPARAEDLCRAHPKLIVLDITGYLPSGPDAHRPAVDLLIQARSGLVFEHFKDRPVMLGFKPALYGAALHALTGILAALIERENSGKGQVVTTSLFEGALTWTEGLWAHVKNPTRHSEFTIPKSATPLLFRCADGRFIQIMLGTVGAKKVFYDALNLDSSHIDPRDAGLSDGLKDPKNFFGDRSILEPAISQWKCDELVAKLKAVGLASEPVLKPGECWDDPQVRHNDVIRTRPDGVRHVGNPVEVVSTVQGETGKRGESKAPLDGIRVVDFGTFVAGPYASVFLRALGADVVKVEPLSGDPGRQLFHFFVSVNRGKRNIALDLKHPDGRAIATKLCALADVVTNNFRTGVSARLGLDFASLQQQRKDQVLLESPGFGLTGPKAGDAGFDMAMQALCGHQHRAGGEGNLPAWSRTSMVDYAGGLLGTIALLLGLFHLRRTGQGVALSVPLINAGVYLLSELVELSKGRFAGAPTLNAQMTGLHPAESLYQTRDGWIAVTARGEQGATGLARALGLSNELSSPPSLWGERERAQIAAVIEAWSSETALSKLQQAEVWAEPCLHAFEAGLFQNPHLISAGTVSVAHDPILGQVSQYGSFVHFSRSAVSAPAGAAAKGEHSRSVLEEAGFSAAAIDGFFAAGAVA